MADIRNVLIVGGIAGLSLAAALQRRGLPAELVERDPDWRTLGAGLAVQANGMRVLRELGIADAVEAGGTILRRWVFVDQRGDVLVEEDMDALWGGLTPSVGTGRANLQRALVEGASGVPCRLGTTVAALAQRDGHVAVRFSDGSGGDYDLLVGADGIHSAVREHVAGRVSPTFGGQIVWRSLPRWSCPAPPGCGSGSARAASSGCAPPATGAPTASGTSTTRATTTRRGPAATAPRALRRLRGGRPGLPRPPGGR